MYVSPDVIRTLDELVRTDLQEGRDSYFWWLLLCTGIVAIGVILEGPEVVHEAYEVFRQRFGSDELNPASRHRTPTWKTLLALLGWILVALGVAGEGISEAFISKADATLQRFNDILLVDAIGRASSAEVMAKGFEAQIASANAASKVALAKVSTAEARIAEAQRDAAVAKLELAKYRAPRVLSREQQIRIASRLESFKTQFALVATLPTSYEAEVFAEQILAALPAHWSARRFLGDVEASINVSAVSGIVVFSTRDKRSIKTADELVHVLISEGISAKRRSGFSGPWHAPNTSGNMGLSDEGFLFRRGNGTTYGKGE